MIFINCLRQYNEIHVITKPCSSTCQVCVSAVRGGTLRYMYLYFPKDEAKFRDSERRYIIHYHGNHFLNPGGCSCHGTV